MGVGKITGFEADRGMIVVDFEDGEESHTPWTRFFVWISWKFGRRTYYFPSPCKP